MKLTITPKSEIDARNNKAGIETKKRNIQDSIDKLERSGDRAVRALSIGSGTSKDTDKLKEIEEQIIVLRREYNSL